MESKGVAVEAAVEWASAVVTSDEPWLRLEMDEARGTGIE